MYQKLVLVTCLLAFFAVVLSAYARLADAGLGCANWPACYAENALKEKKPPQTGAASSTTGRSHTSWQWKLHSQVVQLLGLLSVAVCGIAWRKRKEWKQSPLLPTLLAGLMVFLALFGIMAFSYLSRPIIVSVHLAGGVAMLMMLVWIALQQRPPGKIVTGETKNWQHLSWLGVALLFSQIMLGGWVSSNFAALACTGFPFCQGPLPQPVNSLSGLNNPLSLLSDEKLIALHQMHRAGAAITALYLCGLAFGMMAIKNLRGIAGSILGLIVLQIALGVSNVLFGLPLLVAVLHNAVAMLLLMVLIVLSFRFHKHRTQMEA
jgi:cytochrome c oxidase assembly protein subunit 15